MVADLRPYVVESSSREHAQRRRTRVMAGSGDEAASIVEAIDLANVNFSLAPDELDAARRIAMYVPRDTDVDGGFHRAGKVVRLRSESPRGGVLLAPGRVNGSTVHAPAMGNRETSRLRSRYAQHCQEKPYRVDRVGDPAISNVLASMYGLGWQKQIDGSTGRFVWASDTIRIALATSSYTPNVDTHDFFDDVTNQITGTGYTAGGATLASKTSTYDTATDQVRLDAADPSWTTSTLTARYAIVYVDTAGAASTDPLLGVINFEADVSTTAGTFSITFDSTGLFVFDLT